VFCVTEVPCELESVDCAITKPHDSSAIEATYMNFFILILHDRYGIRQVLSARGLPFAELQAGFFIALVN
jgi:hypothetical protein